MSWKNLTDTPNQPLYTKKEEIANSITGGFGVIIGITGMILLTMLAATSGDVWLLVSFTIYGISLIILHLASTLYHSTQNPYLKKYFQKFDHAAIYLLIAGTYTPFLLVSIRGPVGWTLLILIWGMAVLGMGFKALYLEKFVKLSIAGYVFMGWLGVLAGRQILSTIPQTSLYWLAVGGILYTSGIIFLAWRKIPYNHTIWHIFVLGGSLCHFFAVYSLAGYT